MILKKTELKKKKKKNSQLSESAENDTVAEDIVELISEDSTWFVCWNISWIGFSTKGLLGSEANPFVKTWWSIGGFSVGSKFSSVDFCGFSSKI